MIEFDSTALDANRGIFACPPLLEPCWGSWGDVLMASIPAWHSADAGLWEATPFGVVILRDGRRRRDERRSDKSAPGMMNDTANRLLALFARLHGTAIFFTPKGSISQSPGSRSAPGVTIMDATR